MTTIFGRSLSDLALADVARFLKDAGDESLTWEVKGHGVTTAHIRTAASAFGNSIDGGYLILGAERASRTAPWVLKGVDVGDELGHWVSKALSRMESPLYSVAGPWLVSEGKWVAVVYFRSSPVPPVLTPEGYVHERVVGASPKVTDRAALAKLFDRGERSRADAEAKSDRRADQAIRGSRFGSAIMKAGFVFAIAPTGGPTDRSAVLFSEAIVSRLIDSLRILGLREPRFDDPDVHMLQDRLDAWLGHESGFSLCAAWDGSVSVAYRAGGGGPALDYALASDLVPAAWDTVFGVASAIGGYGPTFSTIVGRSTETENQPITVRRWLEPGDPDPKMIASIRREFERGMGRWAPEPG